MTGVRVDGFARDGDALESEPVDDGPMTTRTVRMPESLTERMEAFWAQHVKPLTGRQYNLSAASRYLIAVGLWAVCHGHWRVKAEPSDRLESP